MTTLLAYANAIAVSSAVVWRIDPAIVSTPVTPGELAAPNAPKRTLPTERFIALLINSVRRVPDAPTSASGTLLTLLMSRAMNRSVGNVLFGAFGAASSPGVTGVDTIAGSIRQTTAEDTAIALAYARSVVIVPGYGLAVAEAQHTVRELATDLEKRGVDVKYAIHPVAGRMPGHMNVLLAEANVPYDQ